MVAEQNIRIRSYLLWEAAGGPPGQAVEFWLQAEAELEAESRDAPKPWVAIVTAPVPRVLVYSQPHRMAATRIQSPDREPAINAAMR
jgi:hypothetical protein